MREIRTYGGNANVEFPTSNRPSRQGSREQPNADFMSAQAGLGDRDEVVTRHR